MCHFINSEVEVEWIRLEMGEKVEWQTQVQTTPVIPRVANPNLLHPHERELDFSQQAWNFPWGWFKPENFTETLSIQQDILLQTCSIFCKAGGGWLSVDFLPTHFAAKSERRKIIYTCIHQMISKAT